MLQTIFSTSLKHQLGLKTENQHQTKKKNLQKNGFKTKKRETQNNPDMQLKCHPYSALIPIDENLNDIGSHVDINVCIK